MTPIPRLFLKKLSQGGSDPEAVVRAIEAAVGRDRSRTEVIEHLLQCFLAVHEPARSHQADPPVSAAQLAAACRAVAEKRGIGPDEFYPLLIERMARDTLGGDTRTDGAKAATRDRILAAAFEIFSEKGFHLATVDEIAERAGLGKGTVYRYFATKEKLFSDLVRIRLEELEREAQATLDGQDDVLTMILKYLRAYFAFFDRNQGLYRLIVQEQLDVGDAVEELYIRKVMRRIPRLKRKIHEASQRGVLKDVDFRTAFHGVMGFVHGVIEKWLDQDCSYSLMDELPAVVEVLFYGFVKDRDSQSQIRRMT